MTLHFVAVILISACVITGAALFTLGYCLGRTDERFDIRSRARRRAEGLLARKQRHITRL